MLIDEFDAGWLEQLDSWANEVHDGSSLYLLIDGVFIPGIWRGFSAALRRHNVSLLFETLPGCSDDVKDASPFILRYEQGNQVLRSQLRQCSGWPMVSVLETCELQEHLAARLAAWCIVENDGQKFNFRFPDTRRLPGIFEALSPRQQGELAGPATCWRYVNRAGLWVSLAVAGAGAAARERPQQLDDLQFGSMVADSGADEAISRLKYRGYQTHGKPSQIHAVVSQSLRLASAHALEGERYLDWCAECLRRRGFTDDDAGLLALKQWRTD